MITLQKLLSESSTRDYAFKQLTMHIKKLGLPKPKIAKSIGFDKFTFGDLSIVSDGVGIVVKQNGKELQYYGNPKLDYKRAVQLVSDSI